MKNGQKVKVLSAFNEHTRNFTKARGAKLFALVYFTSMLDDYR